MNIEIFSTQSDQINAIANYFYKIVTKLLKKQKRITIALSGGNSPIPLFEKLVQLGLDWQKITITLVDERIIAKTNSDSNAFLINKYLLQKIHPRINLNFIDLTVNTTCANWHQIDLAILGMGEDGHTASIFPDCSELNHALDIKNPQQYIITTPFNAPYKRITLTLKALINIPYLILNIGGYPKLKVFTKAICGENINYPISYIIARHSKLKTYWHPI